MQRLVGVTFWYHPTFELPFCPQSPSRSCEVMLERAQNIQRQILIIPLLSIYSKPLVVARLLLQLDATVLDEVFQW